MQRCSPWTARTALLRSAAWREAGCLQTEQLEQALEQALAQVQALALAQAQEEAQQLQQLLLLQQELALWLWRPVGPEAAPAVAGWC